MLAKNGSAMFTTEGAFYEQYGADKNYEQLREEVGRAVGFTPASSYSFVDTLSGAPGSAMTGIDPSDVGDG